MNGRGRQLGGALFTWSFLLVVTVLSRHWTAATVLVCVPAFLGVVALLVAAVRRIRGNLAGPLNTEDPGAVRVYPVPPRAAIRRPRRRPGPPREPLTGLAAAIVDQQIMKSRAEAGEQAPDHDDFVALMRGAGAGDLEDVAAPEDGDQ